MFLFRSYVRVSKKSSANYYNELLITLIKRLTNTCRVKIIKYFIPSYFYSDTLTQISFREICSLLSVRNLTLKSHGLKISIDYQLFKVT